MTIIDRTERAFIAHRDALQEVERGGHSADPHLILDSLTTINRWGDRDQRADLTSEILDALEAGKLDDTARRSLASTIEYLAPDGPPVDPDEYDGKCPNGCPMCTPGYVAPEPYVPTSLAVDAPWLSRD